LECLAAGCLLNSAIRIGVLTEENLDLAFFAKFIQARSIHPDYHLLTAENTKLQEGIPSFPLDSERTKRPKKNKII
jgi:glycerophosphoryl diester phosphodiesterase